MKIILNNVEINFELENEKSAFDVVNAIADFSSSQSPQQFITNIFIDDNEYYLTDESRLTKIAIGDIKTIKIETSDIFGISLLSLKQMEKFLLVIENIIYSSTWNSDFPEILESMSWMRDGIEQIASIFKTEKNAFVVEKLNFLNNFEKLSAFLGTIDQSNFPVKNEIKKTVSILIKNLNDALAPFRQIVSENGDSSSETIIPKIDMILEEIEIIIPKLSNAPVLFQTGQDKEAMEIIGNLTAIFEKSISLFVIFKENMNLYLDKSTVKEVSFENFFSVITEHLKELMVSIENRDSVTTGDLLEYEFLPNLEEIKNILIKIKKEAFLKAN